MGPRGSAGEERSPSARLSRTTAAGWRLLPPRAPGPHAAADRARQRGIPSAGRAGARDLAESRTLLRHGRADDAPHPGRSREGASAGSPAGSSAESESHRGNGCRTSTRLRDAAARPGARRTDGHRRSPGADCGTALLRRLLGGRSGWAALHLAIDRHARVADGSGVAVSTFDRGPDRSQMMETPGWDQVKRAFQAVLDQQPEDRPALLRQMCGQDDALRAEVESLLAAHERAGSFAERSTIDAHASREGDSATSLDAGRLGG